MALISLILALALFEYLERLNVSTSLALISAVAKFIKGSDEDGTSWNYITENQT